MSNEFIYLGMDMPTFTKLVAAILAFIGAVTYFMTGQEEHQKEKKSWLSLWHA